MHFTYATPPEGDLQQGDVLRRTPELDAIILRYHPYYSQKADYTHFLVLSQSCDLVQREGRCKTPYVSLSAVRPLHLALEREAQKYQTNIVLRQADALSDRHRSHMETFARKLLNNNEPEYFYLHELPALDLQSSCAFLRLAISIRSDEHYNVCRAARIVTLSDEFRAKLGWLMGNIFARVGTTDWVAGDLDAEVRMVLDASLVFLKEEKIKAAKLNAEGVRGLAADQIRTMIDATKPPSRKDEVLDAVMAELVKGRYIAEAESTKIRLVLANAPTIASRFK